MQILQNHPISNIFPAMNSDDYARLVESIRINGLLEPIWLFDDQILDGRHRYRACNETGTKPKFQIFTGSEEAAMAFSLSRNLERRHLTTEQKAALGVSIKAYEAERAKERQGTRTDIVENFPQGDAGKARDKAGEAVGVAGKTIDKAEKIAEAAPDVFERMKQGQYGSVETARKVADLPQPERVAVHQAMDEGVPAREAVKAHVPHVAQNTGNNEWYTPSEYVEAARMVLGAFDMDPASSPIANGTVQAEKFYTAEDDGLTLPWSGRVWMNPPYEAGLIDKFADKLVAEFNDGNVTQAIVLVNNATETRWFHTMASVASAFCFPKGRIRFVSPNGVLGAPLQGQAIIYIGANPDKFIDVFRALGIVAQCA